MTSGTIKKAKGSAAWKAYLRDNPLFILVLSPGILFIILGVSAMLSPQLIVYLLAVSLIVFGVVFCLLAWKFVELKNRFHLVTKEISSRVVVHGVDLRHNFDSESSGEGKKIIYH